MTDNTDFQFDGTWACVNGSTLICTAPTLASGGVATFTVSGTVALTAQDGDVIVNEIAAGWANSPFGPDVTVRDGNAIRVLVNAVVPITPRRTGAVGGQRAGSFCAVVSTPAKRSPTSSTRAPASRIVQWSLRRSGSSSSSHRIGIDTGAPADGRTE